MENILRKIGKTGRKDILWLGHDSFPYFSCELHIFSKFSFLGDYERGKKIRNGVGNEGKPWNISSK